MQLSTFRRKMLSALTVGALVGLVAACGGSGDSNGKTTLTYRIWDEQQQKGYEKVFEAFKATHPDIDVKIELQPYDQYWTKLVTEMVSGTAPDVFWMTPANFPELATKGALMDVTDAVEKSGLTKDRYHANVVDSFTYKGKMYAAPKDWGVPGMLYNKQVFAEAGVAMPTEPLTWAPDGSGTFLPLMRKLTVDANGKHPDESGFDPAKVKRWGFASWNHSGTQWLNWIPSNGGTTITKPYGAFNFNEPASVEALQWGVDLIKKWHVSPPAEQTNPPAGRATEMFQRGEVAVFPANNALLPFVAPGSTFPIGTASLPAGKAGRVVIINGLGEAVYSRTEHPDQAKQLVSFLATPQAQAIMAEGGYVFPAINDLAPRYVEHWKAKGIDTQPFLDEARGKTVNFPIVSGFAAAEPKINQIFNDMYLGSVAVPDAAGEAVEQGNALLTPEK
ncbi:ABC transporter substrate-binding protein [Amycolatopsis sp. cmx-4-54]|uniref:ABC transporter substrate-binding protein n=1 Tax=Amycolatopsis sp. cmx-4-54 TaxID=2790936 RepID=UPI003978FF7F